MFKYFQLFFFIVFIPFRGNSSPFQIPSAGDTVYIHGQIKTHRQKNNSIVTFDVDDYVLGRELSHYSNIDSAGKFEVKFVIRGTQDLYWRYNEDSLFRLIASPKDSLSILIDKTGVHFFGRNAKPSEDINLMMAAQRKAFPYQEEQKALSRLEPEDYFAFRRQQKDKQIKFLDSFCTSRNCSALFKEWYLADVEVRYYDELLAYGWKSLKHGVGSPDRLTGDRRNNYLSSFIEWNSERELVSGTGHLSTANDNIDDGKLPQLINLNNEKYLLSHEYTWLINDLSHQYIRYGLLSEGYVKAKVDYLLEFRNELSTKEVSLLEEISTTSKTERDIDSTMQKQYYAILDRYRDKVNLRMTNRYIEWTVSETSKIENINARDLILCQYFCNYIHNHDDIEYYYNLIRPKINNPNYLKVITADYNEVKQKHDETDQLKLSEFQNIEIIKVDVEKTGDQLINSILLANKNKVIFLDLWGTWCAPCRSDFGKMTPLKSSPLFDSVSFVYLCCHCNKNEWITAIKKYNLKGTHYLLTDSQFAALEKRLKIKGFPTYLVIDKQRKLHSEIKIEDTKVLTDQIREFVSIK